MMNTTRNALRGGCVQFLVSIFLPSFAVRHHLWKRDHHLPADVRQHQPLPRDAQQRQGLPETLPGAQGAERAGHGLHRLHLVHVQRHRHGEGETQSGLSLQRSVIYHDNH